MTENYNLDKFWINLTWKPDTSESDRKHYFY